MSLGLDPNPKHPLNPKGERYMFLVNKLCIASTLIFILMETLIKVTLINPFYKHILKKTRAKEDHNCPNNTFSYSFYYFL